MAVKIGSSGGGASSHEGKPNPLAPMPTKQSDSISKGGGTNDVPQKLYDGMFSEENYPKCDSDYSGTSDRMANRPETISVETHDTREQAG